MIDDASMSSMAVVNAGRAGVSAVAGPDPMYPPPGWLSYGLEGRAEVPGQAFEIQHPADQVGLLPHPAEPAAPEAAEAMPVLPLAKELLDQLPAPLRHAIRGAAFAHAHAGVGLAAAAGLRGNVGLDAASEQRLEEVFVEEPLVGAEGGGAESQPPLRPRQQRQTAGLLRGRALKDLHAEAQQEPVAILHHGIDGIARIGTGARRAFGHESTVRVGDRAMGRVAPLLATEVDGAIAGVRRTVLRRP